MTVVDKLCLARLLLLGIGATAVAAPFAIRAAAASTSGSTQSTQTAPAATAMLPPMDGNADPAFEVATIKPSKSDRTKRLLLSMRRFRADNTSLDDLITFSYGVHPRQIMSAPPWMEVDRFDIEAEPDGEGRPSMDQWKIMVRKLLADRHQLKFHQEKRELPVYLLSVNLSGPKLMKSPGTPMGLPGMSFGGRVGGDVAAINASMADFINFMTRYVKLDRPIVDQTGLTGRYDFTLDWSPDDSQFDGAAATLSASADDANSPHRCIQRYKSSLGSNSRLPRRLRKFW